MAGQSGFHTGFFGDPVWAWLAKVGFDLVYILLFWPHSLWFGVVLGPGLEYWFTNRNLQNTHLAIKALGWCPGFSLLAPWAKLCDPVWAWLAKVVFVQVSLATLSGHGWPK